MKIVIELNEDDSVFFREDKEYTFGHNRFMYFRTDFRWGHILIMDEHWRPVFEKPNP